MKGMSINVYFKNIQCPGTLQALRAHSSFKRVKEIHQFKQRMDETLFRGPFWPHKVYESKRQKYDKNQQQFICCVLRN